MPETGLGARRSGPPALDPRRRGIELYSGPAVCVCIGSELIEPQQRGSDNWIAWGHKHASLRGHSLDPVGDRLDHLVWDRSQHPAAQNNLGIGARQLQTPQSGGGKPDHLIREPANNGGGDRILSDRREHDRSKFSQPRLWNLPQVDSARDLGRVIQTKVGRHRDLQDGPGPAAVRTPRCRRQGGQTDVPPTSPVTAHLTQCQESDLPAVGCPAEAIDPGAADYGDAPPSVGAGAQESQGVVLYHELSTPAEGLKSCGERGALLGQISPGEQ